MRALLSVYDKKGIADLARALHQAGVELVSTGGTYRTLRDEAKLPVKQVSDLTDFPEILDGRVKTLHPRIHGGILARRDVPAHRSQMAEHGIGPIDLVAANLYPFVETISRSGVTLEEALENIDIGGPAMVRAAAKNFPHVIVVTDPGDYGWIAQKLSAAKTSDGLAQRLSHDERRKLAQKAFQHVALYDTAVSQYLATGGDMPAELTLGFRRVAALRYGENPHQAASLYADMPGSGGIATAKQLHGKELSFNNILDADAAWRVASDFDGPAVAVIKHCNPCGLATHQDLLRAYQLAYEGDTVSAYGGIVGFNRPVTSAAVEAMRSVFYEVVVAPAYEPAALKALQERKNLRVLEVAPAAGLMANTDVRRVSGGVLVQTADNPAEDPSAWRAVTQRVPSEEERIDLAFAWKAAKHVKSNAIVLAKRQAIVGIGAGQPNRVNSVHLAIRTAGERSRGSVLASDAFFPFPDNIERAAEGGVTAIVQPGGSIRDDEVVAAANKAGIAMLFTGIRHFRH
ncbi:MAG: bifunctional phosphoribosylaminoimidazolecarboxamide formyltransferase/IMP cyclohydrolase [SAR202 cluster bacterium]|nr:bifunctional phosphoribosylaminoimidazolecarboxamide formyltransferase/IMP cyclohydrolase [SAR202 cluster bacterium]